MTDEAVFIKHYRALVDLKVEHAYGQEMKSQIEGVGGHMKDLGPRDVAKGEVVSLLEADGAALVADGSAEPAA